VQDEATLGKVINVNELLEVRHGAPAANQTASRAPNLANDIIREEEMAARLQALESYEILDSAQEKSYDDIARLTAYVCGAPVAFISFFDRERQWLKSRFSSGNFTDKTLHLPASSLLCERLAQQTGHVLQITDATLDEVFAGSGAAAGSAKFRFYAAMPIYSPSGDILGALTVLDRRVRTLTLEQCQALETLSRQIMELLEMRRTLIGLSDANAKLGQQNITDALTGVPNRRAYDQKLTEEYSRAKRTGTPLSMLLIDIDNFKEYNDNFGHPAGDTALQSVARVLMSSLRPYDFLARYGGEEFVIILPATDLTDAIVVAERVRSLVAGSEFPHRKFTISIGVARLDVDAGARALVQAADNGLYRAKAAGRNKVLVGKINDASPAGSATP
jgi:diguanylate cyclase (GGDEF)-like protein